MLVFQKTPGLLPVALAMLLVLAAMAAAGTSWQADEELVRRRSASRSEVNWDEAKVPEYELPNPLERADGALVSSPQEWPVRRAEIMELFRTHMFGRRPPAPQALDFKLIAEDPAALGGAATLRRIDIISRQDRRTHRFELILFVPNAVKTPAPAFLLINNRPSENIDPTRETKSPFWPVEAMITRGYAIAAFGYGQLAPDDPKTFRDGVIRLFEGETDARPADAGMALAAWGWGASRAMDYFQTDPRIDAKRVAVVGHSRGGKAALWAGAEDDRFALVVSNGSGCGGAALSRRRLGETVAIINDKFPHWFCDNFKRFNHRENELPFDQHMLIALMAPRAVYVASGSEDLWADPRGEFLALAGASGVYGLWGLTPIAPDDMPPVNRPVTAALRGYHIHEGPHNLTEWDWMRFADFADGLWPR